MESRAMKLRAFPQDLENAARFPQLPQPLPAT